MSSNLPLKMNFGSEVSDEMPYLAKQLDRAYTNLAASIQTLVKKNVVTGADPQAIAQVNSYFSIGDITVRTDTNAVWVMTSRTTPTAVTWTLLS